MPSILRYCNRGADDLAKNVSGMAGTGSSSHSSHRSVKRVKAGNGICIVAKNSKYSVWRSIRHMRSLCPGAAMLSADVEILPMVLSMTRGKAGQTSRSSLAGVPGIQTSRRLRRRGDPKTTRRHRLHTCNSVRHAATSPGPFGLFGSDNLTTWKSNISSRTSSGSTSIGVT